ncbi:bacteriocin family protein [Myxococcota bacterium]|jgi:uncharacterized linocin/CFP29 family protein|nr:bacteriocin family protein [Myxococcota bacterium]
MNQFSNHNDNPLNEAEFRRVHDAVIEAAKRRLVGRRFIELYGPMGPGVQAIAYDEFTGTDSGQLDLLGESSPTRIFTDQRRFRTIPILYKDFVLHWRDLEMARQLNMPLDVSAAAGAASWCAEREDQLIFYGDEKLGYEGLMNHPQRQVAPLTDGWGRAGAAFRDVVDATEKLFEAGHYGPYALVCSPRLYANLHRLWEDSRTMELDNVRRVIEGEVFQSNVLRGNVAVLVSKGQENLDLAVSIDMTTAYLGAERMNHPFRVLEALILRIKHPDAICTIEAGA